jgi:hypothetical protein
VSIARKRGEVAPAFGRSPAELAALAGIASLAAVVLALSWNRWVEPIIDLGRDLYIPEAMVGGARLYDDLLYFYPPLTPSILALIVAVLGSSLAVYTAIGIATALAAATALYALVRATAGWPAAAAVAVLFVSMHLAGTSTWGANFIFPYAHAATFGMTFFLIFAASLARHLFVRPTVASAWTSVAFGLLSAAAKIEYILAVGVVVLVAVVVYRFPVRYLAALAVAGIAAFGGIGAIFRGAEPGHHWLRDNVLASSLLSSESASLFYSRVSGLAMARERIGPIVIAALIVASVVALLAIADRAWSRGARMSAALALLAALAGTALLLHQWRFFASWPLILLALVPFAAKERSRSPLAFLLAASLGTAIRIFLAIGPGWYGFVLVLPTYALIAYVFATWLPSRRAYRSHMGSVWLLLALAISAMGIYDSIPRWAARSEEVVTARGTYLDDSSRGEAIGSLLEWLESRPPDESLVVVPEGLAINYFAARPTPLSFYTFTPIEIDDPITEGRIIEEFRQRRPDLVVVVPRDVREFGYRGFGVDYARELAGQLQHDYRLAWRSPNERYPVFALERAEGAP